jgi:nitroreductase
MKQSENERRHPVTNEYLKPLTRPAAHAVLAAFLLVLSGFFITSHGDTPATPSMPLKAVEATTPLPAPSGMDTLTAIFTRHSIRKYTSQPVSDETIKLLLRAAMAAPSARNEQAWEFIVIRDKKTLAQLPNISPFAAHVPHAQAAILVVGNKKLEAVPGLWITDCSNATMNILLAAHSLGLGAVWTTLYPYEDRTAGMKKLVNLPDHIAPLAIIPLGYPAEKKPREDRFKPEKIHYEKY